MLTGSLLGYDALYHNGSKRNFFSLYHNEFAPAVMLACGHGLVDVREKRFPGLSEFLWFHPQKRANTFQCQQIPAAVSPLQPDGFQRMHSHLLFMVGSWWKMFGVAWNNLYPLLGFFHGLTAMGAFLLLRTTFHPLIATVGGVVITTIHPIYWQVMNFRDYSKIPFIILSLYFMLVLITRPFAFRRHLIYAILAGLLFGLSTGFRIDTLVLLPAMLVAFFVSPGSFWQNMRRKSLSFIVFLVSMAGVGAPVFLTMLDTSGNPSPTMYMGLGNGFSQQLQVHHSLYEVEYQYHDIYLDLQIRDHAWRHDGKQLGVVVANPVGGAVRAGDFFIPDYAQAGEKLFHHTLMFMPADVVTRALASVKVIANSLGYGNMGIIATLLALLLIASRHTRMAFFLMFLLLILAGYPSILFKERHYSHLVIVPIWTLCFYAHIVSTTSLSSIRQFLPSGGKGMLWLVAGFWLPLFLFLQGLRHFQDGEMRSTLQHIVSLEREPLPISKIIPRQDRVLLRLIPSDSPANKVISHYLVMQFDDVHCPVQKLPVAWRYGSTSYSLDRESLLTLPEGGITILTQLFEAPTIQFMGIELNKEHLGCLQSVSLVKNFQHLQVVPTLTLPANWQEIPLYQTIGLDTANHVYSPYLVDTRPNGMLVPGMGL
ncbi:MAG: glycosyltransferase family 39 protein [Magnetococcales bacterium]|nr:glycosyltransferase family 39 protein [Magnetococcales bacterium]